MEPFSIVCQSCASRLKVTRASTVGQRLACPKCGTMIHVVPPDGWQPPAEPGETGSGLGSFEDIDQILGEATTDERPTGGTAGAKRQAAEVPRPRVPGRQTAPLAGAGTAAEELPVLPGQEWTSQQAQKKRRLILLTVSAAGVVLVVAAIIVAIVQSRQPTPIAQGEPDPQAAQAEPAVIPNEGIDPDTPPPANAQDPDGPDGEPPLVEQPLDPAADATPPPGLGETPPPVLPGMEGEPEGTFEPPTSTDVPDPPGKPAVPPGNEIFGGPTRGEDEDQEPARPGMTDGVVEKLDVGLGELATLLEQSDTSLQQLRDAAALQAARSDTALTKYAISPPDDDPLDLQRQLELPVGGVTFAQPVPLTRALRLLTKLSSVPVTLDVQSLARAGLPTNPELPVNLQNLNVLAALQQLVEPAGLEVTPMTRGVVVTLKVQPGLQPATFAFPQVGELTREEQERFLASIQSLIAPQAWLREEDPATIAIEDGRIAVVSEIWIQQEIQRLIEKLDGAATLLDADDRVLPPAVVSRWNQSAERRQQDPDMPPSITRSLQDYLDQLQRQTGLTVVVDWERVGAEGWTPFTEIPGILQEPTVDQTLNELAVAMGLRLIGVDESTIVLTTSEMAHRMLDLEVYPLSADFARQVDAETINELVLGALGGQLPSHVVRVIYEPRCRAVIVLGPQFIQRQVESLLRRVDP